MNVPSTYSGEVKAYLNTIEDEQRLSDCLELMSLMIEITGEQPKIWQNSIIGFGSYHYKYRSGREGDWILTGFSSRKSSISIYIISGFEPHQRLLANLGKYKTGTSCLYIKSLALIKQNVLRELIQESVHLIKSKTNDHEK